ncbi:hypothetical protein IAU60_002843 [Kwoniella sp. DSM 27419]
MRPSLLTFFLAALVFVQVAMSSLAAQEIVPIGCISGKYFHDHVLRSDGSTVPQANRKECREQCQVTGFKYAFYRKASRKCHCTSNDRFAPPASEIVRGTDREGRCKDAFASIDYMQSQYKFDRCYDMVPGITSRKKLVKTHEACFDYCHGRGDEYDSWVVSIVPQAKSYLCKCFTSYAPGKGSHTCGPHDAFRYVQ